ncbi:MAG TPA: tRNA (adenosine(37)-N6)-threonylcarbamoyltransferase complex transferase subunit TsaD [Chitinophagales bacterium]|nr:tRNA (adenosine(37)-N6)-threonylcarbamoyltransferase complex transferase subunit TsaD [Chitinophagales bacterium]
MTASHQPVILAIESSCDETSAAVWRNGGVASNVTATQDVHRQYGGVVPELASRVHQQHIVPVVHQAVSQAGLKLDDVDAVAVTVGPGLIGSLLVGISFAKGLALALNKTLICVNHMQAHVAAHYIDHQPVFPFLCLTVSGGHTQLVVVNDFMQMEIIGQTLDDAAGEAFDKAAKLLGLSYPGGPMVDWHAQRGEALFQFPEPQIPGYDFSFSGLKTAFLYFVQDKLKRDPSFLKTNMDNVCASIQQRIVTILLNKLKQAANDRNIKHVALAGGVSANSGLRKGFEALGKKEGWTTYIPKFEYCTDNAAMIAAAAFYMYEKKQFAQLDATPHVRMPF